jgi:putative ABC transport system permease protein
VVGYDLAERQKVAVGGSIDVRGQQYEVVGTLDRTYVNLLDSAVFVTLADAQQMYYQALPASFQRDIKPEDLVLQANVYTRREHDPDQLASALNRTFDGILATGPTKMMDTVNGLLGLINAIVWSVAGVALVVSAFSIVNTMLMAVGERTREIGVKRALGASRWIVARDVLVESGTMGALGGVGGIILGLLVAVALNAAVVAATGSTMLVPTPRLALGALLFAVVLGAVGGSYPALRASRLDPPSALAKR